MFSGGRLGMEIQIEGLYQSAMAAVTNTTDRIRQTLRSLSALTFCKPVQGLVQNCPPTSSPTLETEKHLLHYSFSPSEHLVKFLGLILEKEHKHRWERPHHSCTDPSSSVRAPGAVSAPPTFPRVSSS